MITVNINEDSSVSITTTDKNKRAVSKKCSLDTLVNKLTTLKADESDTGFLFPNLLREVSGKVVKRIYYYPSLSFPIQVQQAEPEYFKDNEHFTVSSRGLLEFKEFKIKDVCGIFVNNNTAEFNNTAHYIGMLRLGITRNITDSSEIILPFPNHFRNNICWADSFDKETLNCREHAVQSGAIRQYYTSKFNSDLFDMSFSLSSELQEGLDSFLSEVLTDEGRSCINSLHKYFLTFYYLSTVRDINPSKYISSRSYTLSSLL